MRKRKGEYKLFHKSQVLRILVEPCRFTTATPAAAGRDGIFRLSYSGECPKKAEKKATRACKAAGHFRRTFHANLCDIK